MTRTRAAVLLAASALGVSLVSACGTGYRAATAAARPAAEQTAAIAQQQPGEQQQGTPLQLAAGNIANLGSVVTDGMGMTLYRFDRDTASPPTSNCNGPCAMLWPPVLATSDTVQLSGIDKGLIGTTTRADGTRQLTLKGWPLYRYAKDTASGEACGQGVGQTWFAATPDGTKSSAHSAADDGSGYGY